LKGLVRLGAPEYFDPGTVASLLALFRGRYAGVQLEIEMGIGPDIAALFDKGILDVGIINREIGDDGDDPAPFCTKRGGCGLRRGVSNFQRANPFLLRFFHRTVHGGASSWTGSRPSIETGSSFSNARASLAWSQPSRRAWRWRFSHKAG
jgi:DNA-binding transcriptional LysR family regulator